MFHINRLTSVIVSVLFFFQCISIALANEKDLVILIGVTKYDNTKQFNDSKTSHQIMYDVTILSERFSCGGRGKVDLITLTDDSASLSSIQETFAKNLAAGSCSNRRTAIVYFIGHEYSTSNGMLLAVKDSDRSRESSLLSPSTIAKSLSECGAENCLFFIDAYNADPKKKRGIVPVNRDIASPGVITIAHSSGQPNMVEWSNMDMSNFSFWVNEGLKGYADKDTNASIDTKELADYLIANLQGSASPIVEKHSSMEHFQFFSPLPRWLHTVMDDIADQIIYYANQKNTSAFYSSGFLAKSFHGTYRSADFDGEEYNELKKVSAVCTSELERRVNFRSSGQLAVSDQANQQGPTLKCEIQRREKYYFLKCTISYPKSGSSYQESDEITITQQVLIRAACETPAPQTPVLDYIPCRVFIEVKTESGFQSRTLEKIDGQYYAALNPGEVYRVVVHRFKQPTENPRRLGFKLFVDGASTLPQALPPVTSIQLQPAESAELENTAGSNTETSDTSDDTQTGPQSIVAQEVCLSTTLPQEQPILPLDTAKFYFLCGSGFEDKYNFEARHTFSGFLKTAGEEAQYREFLVAPGNESVGEGENIGIITAAFYELTPTQHMRGTIEGEYGITRAPIMNGYSADKLLQKVTIRYVPEAELPIYRTGLESQTVLWAE